MSLEVARSEGVTVLTVTSKSSSGCPALCQLLGALCCSPGLCSVSRRLPLQRRGPQAALGALWIITGLLHIGLGLILFSTKGAATYWLRYTCRPVWLGVVFMLVGVSCILTERYPRPIVVLLSGLLNLIGLALCITALVWYFRDVTYVGFSYLCRSRDYFDDYNWRRRSAFVITTTASPEQSALKERCEEARALLWVLTTSIRAAMITVAALDLCLGISSATLSFKALKQGLGKKGNKPLLKEDKATPEKGEES